MLTPQQRGATIEALIRYEGQVDRARRYLGISKREMKTRAKDVLNELPSIVADSIMRGLDIMVGPTRGKNTTVEEVARRLSVLADNKWNFHKAAQALDITDTALYSFIKRPKTREYAASNGVEIPLKFTYKPRTTAPNPVPPTPIEIANVLMEALKTTAIIHDQAKDGLLAMQIALTEATEKAISEIFHIVRSSQNDRQDTSHL